MGSGESELNLFRSDLTSHQIIELDGTVVLYPDKATTHVIYDSHNRTKAKLAKLLRLQSLDELPLGTECVIWEWISQSKLNVNVALFPTVSHVALNEV